MPRFYLSTSLKRQLTTNSRPKILSTLQSCTSSQHLNQLHAHLITTNQIKDAFIATKLVEAYAIRNSNIDFASRVFNRIKNPDSYAWTTMIRGFVLVKNVDKAIESYELMRTKGVEINKFTFLFLLKAYGLKPNFRKGSVLHGMIITSGFACDLFIHNALIHMFSKCGLIKDAYKVFDEMRFDNVVVYNTLIVGLFACGDIENGLKLFDEMPDRNTESWNAVIGGYCKLGQLEEARSLFDQMSNKDLVSWGTMISGYMQNRRAMDSLELFEAMQFTGVNPDRLLITTVLSACAQIGALGIGRWVHAYMSRNKMKDDVYLGTSLVDMYAKCGCIDVAFELFRRIQGRNLCTWNAMLSGLAINGHGVAALKLFREMECNGVQPNDITFVAVLTACSHIGWVKEGWKLFNRMQNEFNITPKIEHYGCIVDVLGRGGLIDEAKELIRTMPLKPNVVIWGALLNACKIHGYTDIRSDDDVVVGNVVKSLDSGGDDDDVGGYHVLLSNVLATKSEWQEVEKTRKMMREEGFERRTPGCSSIEVDSVVHEFVVKDQSKYEWDDLREVVERLSTHMENECI